MSRKSGETIFSRGYVALSLSALALIFFTAVTSLSITTAMPVISVELGDVELYSLAFAAPFSAGVVGMVLAGAFADRRDPRGGLLLGAMFLGAGLAIAGSATAMPIFVVGRFVQGFGAGAITVTLQVVIAHLYPARLQPRVFAAFAGAWVSASLFGPFAAGVVSESIGWRWIFVGSALLVSGATLALILAIRGASGWPRSTSRWPRRRIGWAFLAASSVPAIGASITVPLLGPVISVIAAAAALIAYSKLVPRGTLRLERGLPALLVLRLLSCAAFFGSEVYLPYLLTEQYSFSTAASGISLVFSAFGWFVGAQIQARADAAHARIFRIGALLLFAAAGAVALTAWLDLEPYVAIAAWVVAGFGMGLLSPRITVAVIQLSRPDARGQLSSSLWVSDNLGSAFALSIAGIVTTLAGLNSGTIGSVFAAAAFVSVVMIVVAARTRAPTSD